eukprot:4993587-Pyramimonas_sp.AAC.1
MHVVPQADEYHSHRWTTYVRNPENKDMTHIIDKVLTAVLCLSPSLVLSKPPRVIYVHTYSKCSKLSPVMFRTSYLDKVGSYVSTGGV